MTHPPSTRPAHGKEPSVYGLEFWLCYIANTAVMIAVSLMFRYADFVMAHLGGTEFQLGLIVGVGMVGALAMRLFQGQGIDRYGPRIIWLGSLALFIVATLSHLLVQSPFGPGVYAARILLMISVAGAFGASLAYVSLRVPEPRIAEMIGTLGTSGFVGMAIGPALGDLVFESGVDTGRAVQRMFLGAAGMGLVSLICTLLATRGGRPLRGGRPSRGVRRSPPLTWLIRRYHPGPLLVVAAAMGLTVSLPNTFLRPYAGRLGIEEIRNFFLTYAATAFLVRIATRRLSERVGFRPMIVWGLISGAGGMLCYLLVQGAWTLVVPAIPAGIAHALLFPTVMAAGSISFPVRYRGVATTLTLAMFDLGNLVGQPAVGALLWTADRVGLPAYPSMFLVVAGMLAAAACYYGLRGRAMADARGPRRGKGKAGPVFRGVNQAWSQQPPSPAQAPPLTAPSAAAAAPAAERSSLASHGDPSER